MKTATFKSFWMEGRSSNAFFIRLKHACFKRPSPLKWKELYFVHLHAPHRYLYEHRIAIGDYGLQMPIKNMKHLSMAYNVPMHMVSILRVSLCFNFTWLFFYLKWSWLLNTWRTMHFSSVEFVLIELLMNCVIWRLRKKRVMWLHNAGNGFCQKTLLF